jgi:hypothetical protein
MLFKVLLVVVLAMEALGQNFSFLETRYRDALEKSFELEGAITFNDEQIVLEYFKPDEKVIVYFEGAVSLQDSGGYQSIDFETSPSIHYFFMLIEALHVKEKERLEAFFEWQDLGEEIHLVPREVVRDVIGGVKVLYKDEALKSLHVTLENGDWIRIEIIE